MKNPRMKVLETEMASVSGHQYQLGMQDMVKWMARNGFIPEKQANFLCKYIEEPGIWEPNKENDVWFDASVKRAAMLLGIPEEIDDRANRLRTVEEQDEAAYWNHD